MKNAAKSDTSSDTKSDTPKDFDSSKSTEQPVSSIRSGIPGYASNSAKSTPQRFGLGQALSKSPKRIEQSFEPSSSDEKSTKLSSLGLEVSTGMFNPSKSAPKSILSTGGTFGSAKSAPKSLGLGQDFEKSPTRLGQNTDTAYTKQSKMGSDLSTGTFGSAKSRAKSRPKSSIGLQVFAKSTKGIGQYPCAKSTQLHKRMDSNTPVVAFAESTPTTVGQYVKPPNESASIPGSAFDSAKFSAKPIRHDSEIKTIEPAGGSFWSNAMQDAGGAKPSDSNTEINAKKFTPAFKFGNGDPIALPTPLKSKSDPGPFNAFSGATRSYHPSGILVPPSSGPKLSFGSDTYVAASAFSPSRPSNVHSITPGSIMNSASLPACCATLGDAFDDDDEVEAQLAMIRAKNDTAKSSRKLKKAAISISDKKASAIDKKAAALQAASDQHERTLGLIDEEQEQTQNHANQLDRLQDIKSKSPWHKRKKINQMIVGVSNDISEACNVEVEVSGMPNVEEDDETSQNCDSPTSMGKAMAPYSLFNSSKKE